MPKPPLMIFLPPSEGKTPGTAGSSWAKGTMAEEGLDQARAMVLSAARAAGAAPPPSGVCPAMERYTGVLYRELAWATLPLAARRRGEAQVRTVSGLWGLVAPADPIPFYKLKMSASLAEFGRLATWWKPRLTPAVADLVEGKVVWDLLPLEHRAAMDWPLTGASRRVTVRFLDADGRLVGHWNKLLKGALVRWLLIEQPTGPEALAQFEHPLGYRFDAGASETEGAEPVAVLRAAP